MTNIDNSPVEVQCIAIRCKQDLPYQRTSAAAIAPTQVNHTFEAWLSEAMLAQAPISSGGTALKVINSLNPNLTVTPDIFSYSLLPGVKLTDCKLFNRYFRIASMKTRVLQPGEAFVFKKFSKKPKVLDEQVYIDKIDYDANASVLAASMRLSARKGDIYYLWRFTSIPVAQAAGGSATVTLGDGYLNIVQVNRWRATYVANSNPAYYIPAAVALPFTTTETSIFPGTSTKTAQAPAI